MRQLILTGLAEETDLSSGATLYLLVFNKGELRLPADEGTVKQVLAVINGDETYQAYQQSPRIANAVQKQETMQAFEDWHKSTLPPDHGAAQVPSSQELPPGTPVPKRRRAGDYAMPPIVQSAMGDDDEDDDGAPQF